MRCSYDVPTASDRAVFRVLPLLYEYESARAAIMVCPHTVACLNYCKHRCASLCLSGGTCSICVIFPHITVGVNTTAEVHNRADAVLCLYDGPHGIRTNLMVSFGYRCESRMEAVQST